MDIFANDIDLNGNEFKKLRAENLLSLPTATPSDVGRIVMNTGLGSFFGYNGNKWVEFGAVSSSGGGSYSLPAATETILGGVKIDGSSIIIDGSGVISSKASTGLERIDEGNGDGWRLIGKPSSNYGNIGLNSIDFSTVTFSNTSYGAIGNYSVSFGFNPKVSGDYSLGGGVSPTASGNRSFAWGTSAQSTGDNSLSVGSNVKASGQESVSLGSSTVASNRGGVSMGISTSTDGEGGFSSGVLMSSKSYGEVALGIFGTTYTASSLSSHSPTDRIFNVGNGINAGDTSDAFTILKNGKISMPSAYGSGDTTGTATYSLSVDGSGNIIETPNFIASGFEKVSENGNEAWRFIGEAPADNINRYYPGQDALDAMIFDGTYVGQPDAPSLPYGTKSVGGINFGVDNKDNASFSTIVFGALNQTNAYANAVMIGNYNNAGYGYGDSLIGTYNTTNPNNVNSFLTAIGHNVVMNGSRGGVGLGLAITHNSRGAVIVGTSNVPWSGGTSASNRPAFTVGIGTTTTPSARWMPLVQKDGLNVLFSGEVIANSLTSALIDSEPTGRIVLTREWIESKGATGAFTSNDGKTVTVTNGLITSIV